MPPMISIFFSSMYRLGRSAGHRVRMHVSDTCSRKDVLGGNRTLEEDAGEYNIVRSPLTKLSMDQDYDYLSSKLKNETWFQLCMLKNGEVNEYNFHILHKVRCIQKAWLCYSFNPNKQIGFNRMIRTIQLTQSIDNLPFTI
jgi:hypothetical protein